MAHSIGLVLKPGASEANATIETLQHIVPESQLLLEKEGKIKTVERQRKAEDGRFWIERWRDRE